MAAIPPVLPGRPLSDETPLAYDSQATTLAQAEGTSHIGGVKKLLLALVVLCVGCRRAPDGLTATGTIEVTETDVAPMQTARVSRVLVEEGATVRAGDTIVTLVQGTLDAELDSRRARLSAAEAQLRDLEKGARPAEIERAEADERSARAEAERAERELARLTQMSERGDVCAQQLDNARTLARVAAARHDAAAQAVNVLREGSRPERIRAARSEVGAARAAVTGARSAVGELVLTSPVDAVVMARHAEPGEILPAGAAAVTLGEMQKPFVRVFVATPALPGIHIGDSVIVSLDGRNDRMRGTVVSVDARAQFTPRIALTEEERADLLFGVKVTIADSAGIARPGLPATVHFRGSEARSKP